MSGTPVGNHIRRLRFDAGELTQNELAEKVGITRQTVIALEAGKYAPSLELAFRIAHAFERPIGEVFFWEI
ncbi:MAG TPA: helix-turn-helix transcriptional regulator [Dokdonella sp.]|uniref:helix-turn-helix transcriptional regulator n=1 Tax=Dokdonella sp. TaxID=2291710 RepID=UPI002D7FF4DA|nr:helix-turn-helix transcriptional regulator [Dokdonella sp.]HET9032054.1 helix-turn-helix transcriptional regulator [Dokdonella sp.]